MEENGVVDLQKLDEAEMQAIARFERRFIFTNPKPVAPKAFSIRDLGIEFPLTIITGIAAIVQAAMRTGYKFFELASRNGMGIGSWVDGASAMIGVEGFIAMIGFTRARAQGRELINDGKLKISATKEWIGLIIALAISVTTGLAQSITGTTIPMAFQGFVDWLVVVFLGVGASILAYFAGEISGVMAVRAEMIYLSGLGKFEMELKVWNDTLKAAWEKSDEKAYLHVDLKGLTTIARGRYRSTGVRPFVRSAERTNGPSEVETRITAYLDKNSTAEFIPGPSQVAREEHVSKGYASEIIKKYRASHPLQAGEPTDSHTQELDVVAVQ